MISSFLIQIFSFENLPYHYPNQTSLMTEQTSPYFYFSLFYYFLLNYFYQILSYYLVLHCFYYYHSKVNLKCLNYLKNLFIIFKIYLIIVTPFQFHPCLYRLLLKLIHKLVTFHLLLISSLHILKSSFYYYTQIKAFMTPPFQILIINYFITDKHLYRDFLTLYHLYWNFFSFYLFFQISNGLILYVVLKVQFLEMSLNNLYTYKDTFNVLGINVCAQYICLYNSFHNKDTESFQSPPYNLYILWGTFCIYGRALWVQF
ncbi:hypothetical protein PPERSA_06226 [Pseudocohnilembus persalinus]|uniref:Uncharacterized protein n=1 Tax=Pseudocohnilembus persalinus TaxID=266149 RepID=A0A0V0R1A1_PSEPJ|nr:hypothetical protein PPERSA_06226 [Pseudocohnilembus persalinus]|eukprot:KRX08048.1 hypothetical protein PPERSA_06226 [Pseudocohnilembus persalinus]